MKLKTHRFDLVFGLPAFLHVPRKDAPPESCCRTEKIIHFREISDEIVIGPCESERKYDFVCDYGNLSFFTSI